MSEEYQQQIGERLARLETTLEHFTKLMEKMDKAITMMAQSIQKISTTVSELEHHRNNIGVLTERVNDNCSDINKLDRRVSSIEAAEESEMKSRIKTWQDKAWQASAWIAGVAVLLMLSHFGFKLYG
ncbi:MAG: hypothetical protein KGI54_16920 [Pseudomonadota bacterium]|nr:hypothetical protein [Pseudomonadota bacterium]